jgi:hypothetical protein
MSDRGDRATGGAFREEFGESLDRVLDIGTWRVGRDPALEYQRIECEVREAIEAEDESLTVLRNELAPHMARPDVPASGFHKVEPDEALAAQSQLLYPGQVEAVDGTCEAHMALPMVIHHSGVGLVSYGGTEGTWQSQLFRRETRLSCGEPLEAVLDLLQRRRRRAMHSAASDPLSELARRGITSFMERFILAHEAKAPWRMGHGSPAPLEMIVMGPSDFIIRSIRLVRELIAHGRFVFVASEQSNWGEFMIGQTLRPLEFVVLDRLDEYLRRPLEDWRPADEATGDTCWDAGVGEPLSPREWVARFRDEVAPQVVYGLYRAGALAPPQMFFAHRDHVHTAARIAIADSLANELRGFPMLIDLADEVCRRVYGGRSLSAMVDAASARYGGLHRFQSERARRDEFNRREHS